MANRVRAGLFGMFVAGWTVTTAIQPAAASTVDHPRLPQRAADAASFIPSGWTLTGQQAADLNGDGRTDLAILIGYAGSAGEPASHVVLVAFAEPAGGYRLAVSNRVLFDNARPESSGDVPPNADTIRIERGSLVLSFEHLRGMATYRFRWDGGAMQLIGYDASGVSGGCMTTTSINYLTRRARLTAGYIDQDSDRTVSRRLARMARPTLDGIDPATFDPAEGIIGDAPWCNAETQ